MYRQLAQAVGVAAEQCKKVIKLLDDGATIPFIARYRKDHTGGLDEVKIFAIKEALEDWRTLEKRKAFVLKTLEEQGNLTPELSEKVESCSSLVQLEDVYLPFKKKRKTRAAMARALGLEPLAKMLMGQRDFDVEEAAKRFVRGEVTDVKEALQGARDIMAEWMNERISARNKLRSYYKKSAFIRAKPTRKTKEILRDKGSNSEATSALKYKDFFEFEVLASRAKSHRVLALFRGEKEGFLTVRIEPEEAGAISLLSPFFVKGYSEASEQVELALIDAYKRLLRPAMETELRQSMKIKADKVAIEVFATNLQELLLASPVGSKRILAIDPGFRTGCKVVCLNEKGEFMKYKTVFPFGDVVQRMQSEQVIRELISKYNIEVVGIGNGTAGRETMTFIRGLQLDNSISVFMVNEDGASIYSASNIAREEFPNEDITVRGAISIGRRLMDPLAELVKIDPKSIGVGQYQHDVDQKALKKSLDHVVESCVNKVGVDVNTSSKYLLTYVSGLGPVLAQNIVDFRTQQGRITSRAMLKRVPRMGAKAYEQCAGFLRVKSGQHPLDDSGVHPENYHVVEQMADDLDCSIQDLLGHPNLISKIEKEKYSRLLGYRTLQDILSELLKPGRDPRTKAEAFEFDEHIKTIEDLIPQMILPGIVTNVTKFGAFVDIGIKQNGLIHISNMSDTFVDDPSKILKVNQHISVQVINVEIERGRIGLQLMEE